MPRLAILSMTLGLTVSKSWTHTWKWGTRFEFDSDFEELLTEWNLVYFYEALNSWFFTSRRNHNVDVPIIWSKEQMYEKSIHIHWELQIMLFEERKFFSEAPSKVALKLNKYDNHKIRKMKFSEKLKNNGFIKTANRILRVINTQIFSSISSRLVRLIACSLLIFFNLSFFKATKRKQKEMEQKQEVQNQEDKSDQPKNENLDFNDVYAYLNEAMNKIETSSEKTKRRLASSKGSSQKFKPGPIVEEGPGSSQMLDQMLDQVTDSSQADASEDK